jgi:hypothetical protein
LSGTLEGAFWWNDVVESSEFSDEAHVKLNWNDNNLMVLFYVWAMALFGLCVWLTVFNKAGLKFNLDEI